MTVGRMPEPCEEREVAKEGGDRGGELAWWEDAEEVGRLDGNRKAEDVRIASAAELGDGRIGGGF